MMLRTFHGSCHCGKVRFAADIDLAAGAGKCNCSICAKTRYWGAIVKPDAFRLLTDNEAELSDYQFGMKVGHHLFCPTCGVQAFGRGDIPQIGGPYVSVNLACLDDLDPTDLANAPVRYMDGRGDNWWAEPVETRHL